MKKYIAPNVKVIDIELHTLIAASPGLNNDYGNGQYGNGLRGPWGGNGFE